jgi:hypothetical protein
LNEDFLNKQQAMLRVKVMLRVVDAIPLEQFGANLTKDISCEKIPNDDYVDYIVPTLES